MIPHRGDTAPGKDGRNIPLWIRQGWDVDLKTVRGDARALGIEDATIQLFVDKPANNDLDQAIADVLAARATLDHRGVSHGAAGEEAQRGMETRERIGGERAVDLIAGLVKGCRRARWWGHRYAGA